LTPIQGCTKSLEHHLRTGRSESLPDEKSRCVTCDAEFMSRMEWLDHAEEHEAEVTPAEGAAAWSVTTGE
jgi:hypothetical protein